MENVQIKNLKLNYEKLASYSVYLYILTLFIFTYDVALNKVSQVVFISMVSFSLIYVISKRKVRRGIIYVLLGLFGLLALTSTVWSLDAQYASEKNISLIFLTILTFSIYNIINTKEKIEKSFNAIYLGGYIMIIYALKDYGLLEVINSLTSGVRLGAEINQANAFGLYSSITFFIAIYHYVYKKSRIHLILSVMPLAFALSSGSRKTFIVLIVGVSVLYYFKSHSLLFLRVFLIFGVLTIISYIIYSVEAFHSTFRRLFQLLNIFSVYGEVDSSTMTRAHMIDFGIDMFITKPFLGYGTEQYDILYLQYYGIRRPAHNNYIQILVSFGITGFVLWYSMYFYVIKSALKKAFIDNLAPLILCIFIVQLVSELTTGSLTNKFTYVLIALGFSYINLINKKSI